MARANLNKSKKVLTFTTTASKYLPKRARSCINWNPPFQTSLYKIFKNVFYEVNHISQCLHLEVFLLSKFESKRGGFKLALAILWTFFWMKRSWKIGKHVRKIRDFRNFSWSVRFHVKFLKYYRMNILARLNYPLLKNFHEQ